ncbi:MAG TPA: carbohydrate binding domain-containing protein, partial [Gemmataceae bacterium]
MRTIGLFALLSLLLVVAAAHVRGEESTSFPFVLPWDDGSATITNVGALNSAPAGAGGFIRAKDGHFHDEKGRRVRFLGVNFTFGANFTDHESAKKVAARMHKFGINVVRLHHMDYFPAPNGIFDPRFKDTQHLDPGQLDRLDFLIAQLKKHGIYVNINLHVSRHFNAADGFAEADKLPGQGKVVNFFEPRMIELQKKYARDLLTHRNPYTKTRYVEEPAVAFIELTNENTLLGAAWDGTLDNLPRPYHDELRKQWNAWLKKRYGDMDGLRRAWKATTTDRGPNLLRPLAAEGVAPWVLETHEGGKGTAERVAEGGPPGVKGPILRLRVTKPGEGWHVQARQAGLDLRDGETYTLTFWARADRKRSLHVSAGLDVDDWHNVGLSSKQTVEPRWRRIQLVFTATRTRKDHNRLVFACGENEGTVELAGLSLHRGAEGALPKDASLETANVPLGRPADNPTGRDWIAFLLDTERRYLEALRTYLKDELHAQANVIGSQASYGGLGGALRESRADYTDMHNYWEHPHFPHRPWDAVDWNIRNTPLTRERFGGTLKGLARYRLAGKPFTVSEYNHPAPNDYQAECLPMLAAFAAFQDWDGIYLFEYHDAADKWDSPRIRTFFVINSNPAKMALLPAAAMMFLRGDLAPAAEETRLDIPEQSVVELLARNGPDIGSAWNTAGGVWPEALQRRVSIAFVPAGKGPVSAAPRRSTTTEKKAALNWRATGSDQALFTADAPRSKAAVGLLGG